MQPRATPVWISWDPSRYLYLPAAVKQWVWPRAGNTGLVQGKRICSLLHRAMSSPGPASLMQAWHVIGLPAVAIKEQDKYIVTRLNTLFFSQKNYMINFHRRKRKSLRRKCRIFHLAQCAPFLTEPFTQVEWWEVSIIKTDIGLID